MEVQVNSKWSHIVKSKNFKYFQEIQQLSLIRTLISFIEKDLNKILEYIQVIS